MESSWDCGPSSGSRLTTFSCGELTAGRKRVLVHIVFLICGFKEHVAENHQKTRQLSSNHMHTKGWF